MNTDKTLKELLLEWVLLGMRSMYGEDTQQNGWSWASVSKVAESLLALVGRCWYPVEWLTDNPTSVSYLVKLCIDACCFPVITLSIV